MKAKFNTVYALATTDKKFLRALLKGPGRALRSAGINLSKEEKRELVGDLNAKYVITGKQLLLLVNALISDMSGLVAQKLGTPPPPPPPFRRLPEMRKG